MGEHKISKIGDAIREGSKQDIARQQAATKEKVEGFLKGPCCANCFHGRLEANAMDPQSLERFIFCYEGPYQLIVMPGPRGMSMASAHPQVAPHGTCDRHKLREEPGKGLIAT